MTSENFNHLRNSLALKSGAYDYYSLEGLEREGLAHLDRLPFSIRTLLEGGVYFPPSQFEAAFVSPSHSAGDVTVTLQTASTALAALRP